VRLRLAAAFAIAGAALHFTVTAPARAALARLADEQRALRAERRALMQKLVPLERAEAARARALAALAAAPLPEGRAPQTLRRTVLATLAGEPLRDIRVSVRPGQGEVAAAVELACRGGLEPVMRAVTRLIRSGNGLVLARTRLTAADPDVGLELQAEGLRSPP
jgi:hypothetical protein